MHRSATQSVFKSLLNCTNKISLSRNATGREFQRQGPAMEKLLSPRGVRVLFVAHVKRPTIFALGVWDRQTDGS